VKKGVVKEELGEEVVVLEEMKKDHQEVVEVPGSLVLVVGGIEKRRRKMNGVQEVEMIGGEMLLMVPEKDHLHQGGHRLQEEFLLPPGAMVHQEKVEVEHGEGEMLLQEVLHQEEFLLKELSVLQEEDRHPKEILAIGMVVDLGDLVREMIHLEVAGVWKIVEVQEVGEEILVKEEGRRLDAGVIDHHLDETLDVTMTEEEVLPVVHRRIEREVVLGAVEVVIDLLLEEDRPPGAVLHPGEHLLDAALHHVEAVAVMMDLLIGAVTDLLLLREMTLLPNHVTDQPENTKTMAGPL